MFCMVTKLENQIAKISYKSFFSENKSFRSKLRLVICNHVLRSETSLWELPLEEEPNKNQIAKKLETVSTRLGAE